MRFHKGSFPIETVDPKKKIVVVIGWIDEDSVYGFYRYGKVWKATDLMSGTLIVTEVTRKACVEWIEGNFDRIDEKKNTFEYREMVESFRILLKEELNGR